MINLRFIHPVMLRKKNYTFYFLTYELRAFSLSNWAVHSQNKLQSGPDSQNL